MRGEGKGNYAGRHLRPFHEILSGPMFRLLESFANLFDVVCVPFAKGGELVESAVD